jgi:hypothetical protein
MDKTITRHGYPINHPTFTKGRSIAPFLIGADNYKTTTRQSQGKTMISLHPIQKANQLLGSEKNNENDGYVFHPFPSTILHLYVLRQPPLLSLSLSPPPHLSIPFHPIESVNPHLNHHHHPFSILLCRSDNAIQKLYEKVSPHPHSQPEKCTLDVFSKYVRWFCCRY